MCIRNSGFRREFAQKFLYDLREFEKFQRVPKGRDEGPRGSEGIFQIPENQWDFMRLITEENQDFLRIIFYQEIPKFLSNSFFMGFRRFA